MKALKFAIIALLVGATAAAAQQAMFVWTALGYQQITPVPTGTKLTVPQATRMAQICVETNNVRYRDDGTAPTAAVGMVVLKDTCITYSGALAAITFIQVTSPAILDISYYR